MCGGIGPDELAAVVDLDEPRIGAHLHALADVVSGHRIQGLVHFDVMLVAVSPGSAPGPADRATSEVVAGFGVSCCPVNTAVPAAAAALPSVDLPAPARLGIDAHRYRSVRWFRHGVTGKWSRCEPWMPTIVDTDTG